jgi:hypothetical protein
MSASIAPTCWWPMSGRRLLVDVAAIGGQRGALRLDHFKVPVEQLVQRGVGTRVAFLADLGEQPTRLGVWSSRMRSVRCQCEPPAGCTTLATAERDAETCQINRTARVLGDMID